MIFITNVVFYLFTALASAFNQDAGLATNYVKSGVLSTSTPGTMSIDLIRDGDMQTEYVSYYLK